MGNLLLYILAIIVLPFYLIWQLIVYIYRLFKPKQATKQAEPAPKRYSAPIYYHPFTTLPFTISEKQIVYTEGSYNEEVNSLIQQNYDKICAHFKYRGYEFCYIPYMVKKQKDIEDNATPYEVGIEDLMATSDQLSKLLIGERAVTKGPQLMYYCSHFQRNDEPNKSILELIEVDMAQLSSDMHEILAVIIKRIRKSTPPELRYSLSSNHSMYDTMKTTYPDDKDEVWKLIHEIESRVEHLADKGIDEKILHQIVAKPEVVSRMVITRDYRIILPDYDDMEINMTPLVKAVYLLFLRHPEGIVLIHLEDYRKELVEIYTGIKGLPLDEKMMQSVVDATNPLNNSINEKVARIREAFVTRFKESLATNYIVHGGRGEAKRIPLHREFVEWQ